MGTLSIGDSSIGLPNWVFMVVVLKQEAYPGTPVEEKVEDWTSASSNRADLSVFSSRKSNSYGLHELSMM